MGSQISVQIERPLLGGSVGARRSAKSVAIWRSHGRSCRSRRRTSSRQCSNWRKKRMLQRATFDRLKLILYENGSGFPCTAGRSGTIPYIHGRRTGDKLVAGAMKSQEVARIGGIRF